MKISTILVSQPAPASIEKSPFFEIASKCNAKFDFHPFIRVQGVSLKEYLSQRIEILDHTAVIFSSRTTIDHFFRICEEARVTIPDDMKYFCNTEAVALYLQKYIVYRKRKIFFGSGVFANFMELLMKHADEKFLLTLSEPYNPELAQTMEKMKLKFHKLIFSRAVTTDLSPLDLARYQMMVFYSPSEIAALVSHFGKDNLPLVATFGENTAKAAIEAGLTVSVMAPTAQSPSMAKALELYIPKFNAGAAIDPVVLNGKSQSEDFIKAQEAKTVRRSKAKKPAAKGAAKPAAKKPAPAKKAVKPAAKPAAKKVAPKPAK